jgi:hypothetical protein
MANESLQAPETRAKNLVQWRVVAFIAYRNMAAMMANQITSSYVVCLDGTIHWKKGKIRSQYDIEDDFKNQASGKVT